MSYYSGPHSPTNNSSNDSECLDSFPQNENILQWVWAFQLINRQDLVTTDGKKVEVIHPGFINLGPGPDFHKAVIRIGKCSASTCDVEIEISWQSWFAHQHHHDFHFAHVGLLVIWAFGRDKPVFPASCHVMEIKPFLSLSPTQIIPMFQRSLFRQNPNFVNGKCQNGFLNLKENLVCQILNSAGWNRMRVKSKTFQAWNQSLSSKKSLIIGLFKSLGNPSNARPMRYLAENLISNTFIKESSWLNYQALLLGLGNWLPYKLPETPQTVHQFGLEIWNIWWRWRSDLLHLMVPAHIWNTRQSRPLNHPQRRLALGAYWLTIDNLDQKILDWAMQPNRKSRSQKVRQLLTILLPPRNSFWDEYYFLSDNPIPLENHSSLIGRSQVIELALDAIFPWTISQLTQNHDQRYSDMSVRNLKQLVSQWPKGQENRRTKHIYQRLLGPNHTLENYSALSQQGLLQIESEYCVVSNAQCERCPMPTHLKGFKNKME